MDPETERACMERRDDIQYVSSERKRQELEKIVTADINDDTKKYISKALYMILPEFEEMMMMEQNSPYHIYTVGEHTLEVMKNIPKDDVDLRLVGLLHDIGKIDTKETDENGIDHFYKHAGPSAERAKTILENLKFSNERIKKITTLVKDHDRIFEKEKSIKKYIGENGYETYVDLMKIQRTDRLGQNLDYEKVKNNLEKVAENEKLGRDIYEAKPAVTIKDLDIKGNDLMEIGFFQKEISQEMKVLLDRVLEDGSINNKETLVEMAKEDYKELEKQKSQGTELGE